jgi:hypothetical protein
VLSSNGISGENYPDLSWIMVVIVLVAYKC